MGICSNTLMIDDTVIVEKKQRIHASNQTLSLRWK